MLCYVVIKFVIVVVIDWWCWVLVRIVKYLEQDQCDLVFQVGEVVSVGIQNSNV